MIIGIGNDIVEIDRFHNIKESFIEKCFTETEANTAAGRASCLAADFSVKESVSKAFGCGIRGFKLTEIEVLRDDAGKPYVKLYGNALKIANSLGIDSIHVSISDTKELVTTFAVAERIK